MSKLTHYLPVLGWGRRYQRNQLSDDLLAAVIVAVMLIPQSLAYAMLAGLPAEVGLYASIFGLLVYGLLGTSTSLSVGPVAVISVMTAAALARMAPPDPASYAAAALTLAFLSGAFLMLLGILRLGFMANFLSHPVISAFITASGIIIAAGQIRYLLGIGGSGETLLEILVTLYENAADSNLNTGLIGFGSLLVIWWMRNGLKLFLQKLGISARNAALMSKGGPLVVVVATAVLAFLLRLDEKGVALVGAVPRGLPGLTLPDFSPELVSGLVTSALLIAIIGFVESVSVGQTLAAKKRERIDPDQELISLGASNIAVAFTGGLPVTGGFSRSIVNHEAGAATPAAGIFTALLIALATLLLTPLIFWLPRATLAATIIVAVMSLVDIGALRKAWNFSRADFAAMLITILLTLLAGIETGIAIGVLTSVLITLYKTSRPHVAVVGRVPGTQHYRNIKRHNVETFENLLSIRIDESLYFGNSRYLEEMIYRLVAQNPKVKHVILIFSAVNQVDMSALETLLKINETLSELKIRLHLSEVKGPIMDRLKRTDFFTRLSGNCYLVHDQAVEDLNQPA
ncbi:MAG: sulfate permease, partial [Pseudohongiellaceae bacterium]